MNNIYFDNAATTYPLYNIKPLYNNYFYNSNAQYSKGVSVYQLNHCIRNQIKKILNVESGKVIMGGTTSQLIFYLINKYRSYNFNSYIYVSPFEHECIYKYKDGVLKNNSCLYENDMIFHLYTNNLTGECYDLTSLSKLCHKKYSFLISDCTATIGHISLPRNIEKLYDCIVASAHKFHGPQNTGFMWISDRLCNCLHLNDTESNEYGLIDGTSAVMNNIAMIDSLFMTTNNFNLTEKVKYADYMYQLFQQYNINVKRITSANFDNLSPDIHAIYIPGIKAAGLVEYLSNHNISISAFHSACSHKTDYRLAQAIGISPEIADQTIRVSFSHLNLYNKEYELLTFVKEIKNFIDQYVVA